MLSVGRKSNFIPLELNKITVLQKFYKIIVDWSIHFFEGMQAYYWSVGLGLVFPLLSKRQRPLFYDLIFLLFSKSDHPN